MKIEHKFFGCKGGFSNGALYESLNINLKSCDTPESLKKNYDAIAAHFKLSAENFILLNQVHGNIAVFTDKPSKREIDADAVITRTPNLIIGISTADCCPILLEDKKTQTIAGIHAGWRSAVSGIIQNTVRIMQELGSEPKDIKAHIGPCLLKPSFECRQDMVNQYKKINPDYKKYFSKKDDIHYLYDSENFVQDRLKETGIKKIEACGIDTYSNPEEYFSYRRHCHHTKDLAQNPSDFGCQLSTIAIRK